MRASVLFITVSVVLVAIDFAKLDGVRAEESNVQAAHQPPASGFRIDAERNRAGPLYAQIGGMDVRIADEAIAAWPVDKGQKIAYSATDGAGGYENEGQSLRVYDVRSGKHRKILSSYYVIDKVSEAKTKQGKLALLVEMRDGGLGASHLAVVDPQRGEVFLRKQVRLLGRKGDTILVGYYHEEDWERMAGDVPVEPYKTARYDLTALLQRKAVVDKPILP